MGKLARVPLSPLRAGACALDSKTAHYLRDVLRLRDGDGFIAFDPEAQLEADAIFAEGAPSAHCTLGAPRAAARAGNSGIVLIQALGKGDKTEQVVRSATALGVSELRFVESARSVARVGERGDSKRARLQTIALDAARQCGRGDVPQIAGPHALDAEWPHWRERTALKVCLVPGAAHSLHALCGAWLIGSPIVLLIGPEGGLTAGEIASAEEVGFVAARFGELVLRTEIAGTAVLGALLLLGQP